MVSALYFQPETEVGRSSPGLGRHDDVVSLDTKLYSTLSHLCPEMQARIV